MVTFRTLIRVIFKRFLNMIEKCPSNRFIEWLFWNLTDSLPEFRKISGHGSVPPLGLVFIHISGERAFFSGQMLPQNTLRFLTSGLDDFRFRFVLFFKNQGFNQFQRTIAQNDHWSLKIISIKKNLGFGSNYKFRIVQGQISKFIEIR